MVLSPSLPREARESGSRPDQLSTQGKGAHIVSISWSPWINMPRSAEPGAHLALALGAWAALPGCSAKKNPTYLQPRFWVLTHKMAGTTSSLIPLQVQNNVHTPQSPEGGDRAPAAAHGQSQGQAAERIRSLVGSRGQQPAGMVWGRQGSRGGAVRRQRETGGSSPNPPALGPGSGWRRRLPKSRAELPPLRDHTLTFTAFPVAEPRG